ncbi:MAG: NAD(P)/FAD-dependent oxidoreductase [Bianqueaceae bacterium]
MDLKPGLDEDALDKRLLRDFEKFALRDFQNALDDLLPQTLIPVILERSGIPAGTKVNAITREQRSALRNLLKDFTVTVHQSRGMEEAIITMGGVDVREINPKTMESKRCPGLFFAGEVLDVDALTGGFNLQIAFSTGVAAGVYAADRRFQ